MTADVYQEPYRAPAWILAILVHGAFFSLLYFGISWQTQKVELRSASMSVELWGSLPAPPAEIKVEEVKVEEVAPIPPPEVVVKPEIVIPEKKPKKPVEIKPEVVKPQPKPEIKKPEVKKPEVKPVEVKKTEAKTTEVKKVEVSAVKSDVKNGVAGGVVGGQAGSAHGVGDQAARDKLAQDAAIGKIVDEFSAKISAKIKRNIVEPPDVSKDARAEFLVTVLPGGRVLPPRLVKSSGNAAYDSAVERAILKSEPLPMPEDAGLFKQFRELKLGFQP
jgi:colicin import membrane protein